MNLASLLFKPKWQDKDPQVRRAAIVADNDADLFAALAQIARSDGDAGVRMAALKRLNDYEAWRERSTGDSDGEIRRSARSAYLLLLCSNDARVPVLARRIAELDTLNAEEVEKVAVQADDHDLRAAALQRVTRPALLAERAVADPDAQLRLAVLERVTDVAALERIAERARKTDKAISRRARELVASRRIESGDADAIAHQARQLCERLEMLMRRPAAADDAAHAAIDAEWQALGTSVPADLRARYNGTAALVRQVRTNAQNPQVSIVSSVTQPQSLPASSAKHAKGAADAAMPALLSVELLASQARFDAALASAAAESQRERELRHVHLHEIDELATHYATTLEAGDVGASHAVHDRLAALASMVGALPAPLASRLAALHARYDELKRWQLWANQQRRQAICASIDGLTGANLHPDALATRVREAREEWQRLDASEGAADSSETGVARRFHALCHRALKPAKVYFNKRDELRHAHSEDIQNLLQTAASLPAEVSDWKAVGALRVKLGEALRTLDAVDPRERTRLGKRIKEAIGAIAPRIDAHIVAIQAAKQQLIERATALAQAADPRSVARDARELQRQWTALGNGKRATDQHQWRAFRAACDAAFGKLDAARQDREAQSTAARALTQDLLAEIDALRADDGQTADAIKTRLRDLDSRWQAQRCDDRAIEQRYRKAHDAIVAHLQDAARQQHLSRYTQAMEKYTLLRAIETGAQTADAVAPRWQMLQAADADLAVALDARHARALAASGSEQADDGQARDNLIELEFLAGVGTPAEDRQRRMNYQVRRLASRMRDRAATTPESELTHVLAAWFGQAAQTDDLEARFARAAQAGIASLP
ncbi:MAG: DUF349 domain-containing protein [Rudaea sp.]